jgi:hypothetical protein
MSVNNEGRMFKVNVNGLLKINKSNRCWKMAIKKVGALSPPHVKEMKSFQSGKYGCLSKHARVGLRRLNGRAIIRLSLGMHTGTTASSWTHPPLAPPFRKSLKKILKMFSHLRNPIGTLQGQLNFWKGQKRDVTRSRCIYEFSV